MVSLAGRFLRFAARECDGVSPLYAALARTVAADDALLALAAQAPSDQPPPNLLFAAVHALLLAGSEHPLRGFYSDLVSSPQAPAESARPLRDFCQRYADAIVGLMRHRRVATNEVARSACLYPALLQVAAAHPGRPMHLIDVGASAGLNLLLDRLRFDYGRAGCRGALQGKPTLHCQLRGGRLPSWPRRLPPGRRLGIDLAPLDVRRRHDVAWLRALIWPEQADRAARLQEAIAQACRAPPDVRPGDAVRLLPQLLAALPAGEPVCVMHAFTLNQFEVSATRRLEALLYRAGRSRPLYRLGYEWGRGRAPQLQLTAFGARHRGYTRRLGEACPHGSWLRWQTPG